MARTRTIALALTALLLAACQPQGGGGGGTAETPAPRMSAQTPEARMLDMVNAERRERGLAALQWDGRLAVIAEAHSRDMIGRDYFAHEAPGGASAQDRAEAAGYRFWVLGENLGFAPTVNSPHEGLMQSPGHRANILNPKFTHMGIGIVEVDDPSFQPEGLGRPIPRGALEGYVVATQLFSKPR